LYGSSALGWAQAGPHRLSLPATGGAYRFSVHSSAEAASLQPDQPQSMAFAAGQGLALARFDIRADRHYRLEGLPTDRYAYQIYDQGGNLLVGVPGWGDGSFALDRAQTVYLAVYRPSRDLDTAATATLTLALQAEPLTVDLGRLAPVTRHTLPAAPEATAQFHVERAGWWRLDAQAMAGSQGDLTLNALDARRSYPVGQWGEAADSRP
ncbi:hypothetical protein, partial [Parachitinimonas caeni]